MAGPQGRRGAACPGSGPVRVLASPKTLDVLFVGPHTSGLCREINKIYMLHIRLKQLQAFSFNKVLVGLRILLPSRICACDLSPGMLFSGV